MNIGILGTGGMAKALGTAWARAGHDVTIGGRSRDKALTLAAGLGGSARAADLREAAHGKDAVLLAVHWEGVRETLRLAHAESGVLAGTPLIDPTNPVDHGIGRHRLPAGSVAEDAAGAASGARVVKALNLFPSTVWERPTVENRGLTVAVCGDDAAALAVVAGLVEDLGARPAVLGGLDRARQVEEAAGFALGLAFSGVDPHSAVPGVPTADR